MSEQPQVTRKAALVTGASSGRCGPVGRYADTDLDAQEALIALDVTAITRLARAAIPGFLARGEGVIVNASSVLAPASEFATGLYPASKSFVLTFSQSLQAELGGKGLFVQAVLPAATRTAIRKKTDRELDEMTGLMDVGEMVDAALVRFDRREAVAAGRGALDGLQGGASRHDAELRRGARRGALPLMTATILSSAPRTRRPS